MKRAVPVCLLALRLGAQTAGPQPDISRTLEPEPVISAPVSVLAPRAAAAVTVPPGRKWRFAHPGATVLAGIRLKELRKTNLLAQWLGVLPGHAASMAGPLLEELDEVYVSLEMNRKSAQPVILLLGRLQSAQIREALQLPSEAGTTGAVLLGEAAVVTAAKRRIRTPPAAMPGKLFGQAFEVSPFYDLWIVGDAAGLASPEVPPDVTSFSFGLNVRDFITADLRVRTETTAGRDNLMALFEAARARVQSTAEGREAWDQLARNLKIDKRDDGLRFYVQIDPARLPAALAYPLGPLAAAPPGRPARRSVVIQGQEGGNREIPYSTPR